MPSAVTRAETPLSVATGAGQSRGARRTTTLGIAAVRAVGACSASGELIVRPYPKYEVACDVNA